MFQVIPVGNFMLKDIIKYVLVAQLCLTLSDPEECNPSGSSPMEFFRKEYRSGQPFPSPGDIPKDPGIKPESPSLQADSLLSEPPGMLKGIIMNHDSINKCCVLVSSH